MNKNNTSPWKYALIPINVLFSPLFFWFLGQYFVPQWVLASDNGYFSEVVIALISSFVFSILIFFFLLIFEKKEFNIRKTLIITLIPLPLSALFAPATVGLMMFLAIFLRCIFLHSCEW